MILYGMYVLCVPLHAYRITVYGIKYVIFFTVQYVHTCICIYCIYTYVFKLETCTHFLHSPMFPIQCIFCPDRWCDSSCLAAPVFWLFCDASQGDRFRETPSWRNAQLDSEQNFNELFPKSSHCDICPPLCFHKQFTV